MLVSASQFWFCPKHFSPSTRQDGVRTTTPILTILVVAGSLKIKQNSSSSSRSSGLNDYTWDDYFNAQGSNRKKLYAVDIPRSSSATDFAVEVGPSATTAWRRIALQTLTFPNTFSLQYVQSTKYSCNNSCSPYKMERGFYLTQKAVFNWGRISNALVHSVAPTRKRVSEV